MDYPQAVAPVEYEQIPTAPPQPSHSFRRFFVIGLISALSVSALIAVVIFAVGNFGETEFRILGTTASVAGFSLVGLCCSLIGERPPFQMFGTIGILLAAVSIILVEIMIWSEVSSRGFYNMTAATNVLAIGMAHAALVLLAYGPRPKLNLVIIGTVVLIAILASMILYLIFSQKFPGESFLRILGSVAILDALGTVVTPLLKKVIKIS